MVMLAIDRREPSHHLFPNKLLSPRERWFAYKSIPVMAWILAPSGTVSGGGKGVVGGEERGVKRVEKKVTQQTTKWPSKFIPFPYL